MLITSKNILSILEDDSIPLSEKDDIVEKNKYVLEHSFNKLTDEQIINYLFNSKIPKSAKRVLSNNIDSLKERSENKKRLFIKILFEDSIDFWTLNYYDKKDKKNLIRLENIKKEFVKQNKIREDDLYHDYIPNAIKEVIINDIYKGDLNNLICESNLPIKLKKEIIDIVYDDNNCVDLLINLKNDDLKNYILNTKFNSINGIATALSSSKLDNNYKKHIARNKINEYNIYEIATNFNLFKEGKSFLDENCSSIIKKYISKIKKSQLFEAINNSRYNELLSNRIVEQREKDIDKQIKKMILPLSFECGILYNKNTKLIDFVIKEHPYKLKLMILLSSGDSTLKWLNLKNIPNDLKKIIIKKSSFKINRAIKQLSSYDIFYRYLCKEGNLPEEIQNKILKLNKDLIIEKIKKMKEYEFVSNLSSDLFLLSIKKMIVDIRVNETNIIDILSKDLDDEIIHIIIEKKADIIKNYLGNLNDNELFQLDKISNKHVKNSVILYNEDYITSRLKNFDEEILFNKLGNLETAPFIKYIILKNFGIEESEIFNCLMLIDSIDCRTALYNYKAIKEFIENSNINFSSFIQYGCGTEKYRGWLVNILNIINDNREKDFIKVKNYLFNNYYIDYKSKENMVSTISDFLELIANFSNNYELLISITSSDKKLEEKDRLNLQFIFKNKVSCKDINKISDIRLNLYEKYKEVVNDPNSNLTSLKKICYQLFFKQSVETLNSIGGIRTLIMLKNEYNESSDIYKLIDELITYSKIIERLSTTMDEEGLRNSLKYIFGNKFDDLMKFENIFSQFDEKVLKLFELDSKYNLTHIEDARKIDGTLDLKLCSEYEGEVFDFSDKNYCLYAHVLSFEEKVEDLLSGKSDGHSNFISVSPISYLGQKYYFDYSNMILAFDSIPRGSFICSSISNMGSNGSIKNNSSEVSYIVKEQRGILETSAVTKNNSEALLYREGLKPCGIILIDGKVPTEKELFYHQKYNLPFIVTQQRMKPIDNPNMVFKPNIEEFDNELYTNDLNKILNILDSNVKINKENDIYTGREVALITDCHSMYEPTIEVLEDIRKRGISEIYSLGDNVGLGPNPDEVFDMLEEYGVKTISGNSEYYNTLGIEPFDYFDNQKIENQEWTYNKLGTYRINKMKLYQPSLDICVGNKKIALCHFANDIRWDYPVHSTWSYQGNYKYGTASQQFLYTNSDEALRKIDNCITSHKKTDKFIKGYLSAKQEPLFNGKLVTDYDAVFQGHVHFDMKDKLNNTDIYTLRAVGMGYEEDSSTTACYYILKEKKDGTFDVEKKLIKFNKNLLLSNVKSSGIPHKEKILSFLQ